MLRITGGELRGRTIRAPKHGKTRPTQAKLRQALFNSLQAYVPDARVLDLFAGSGALGLEALSRGAEGVTFVEEDGGTAKLIAGNALELGVSDRSRVLTESVERLLAPRAPVPPMAPFDIVLADPPYQGEWELRLPTELPWERLLREGGLFCLEWGARKSRPALPDRLPFLVKVREKNYGDSMLTTYRRETSPPSEQPGQPHAE